MIEIVDYRPEWPAEFQRLATKLRCLLSELALRIDHIGSTAVPRLAAKDVIDVQITAAEFSEDLRQGLLALGYAQAAHITGDHRPPGDESPATDWQKWFFRAPVGERPTNTHVRIAGRRNQRYPLLFRDYLRAHPAIAAAYDELKRRLAKELRDPETYPDVKDPAVDLIYLPAEEWAKRTEWQVGKSDA
ncbi:dephospho-CoA kinase/protein folding accessory domain-containing protein [Anatilimnocola aggregata]|uniref:Dephospho-CoA kinase/protein folding accessory domain-containing protein n=1 Tax=Anatilimnocola aggregata TaxID=2528021 RepID=A0A517YBV6_9BACT|nr:GrpB family protein [Anatilimnocola aggregata]QDU27704.1 dephospho-CoA kinase/protein folding accessory domain-containing protein [Anatilimnocola aggregata]